MSKNQLTTRDTRVAKAELARVEYFTPAQVELIKRQIAPGASDDQLQMFMRDCERSQLDPFARQIYSIERKEKFYDSATNQWRWRSKRVTQYSIEGFRLIAERTGKYAGQLGPEWCSGDGAWRDVWLADEPPAAARVAVLRGDFAKPLWTPAVFNEYCPRNDKGEPTGLWKKMPSVMIAKCAEALALRRAFPNELSNAYTGDEMMQAEARDVTPRQSLAEEMGDEIPEHDHEDADPGGGLSGEAASAADTPMSTSPAAGALTPALAKFLQKLQDVIFERVLTPAERDLAVMGYEAAIRGEKILRPFFHKRSPGEKNFLRKFEAELIALYPLTSGGE